MAKVAVDAEAAFFFVDKGTNHKVFHIKNYIFVASFRFVKQNRV